MRTEPVEVRGPPSTGPGRILLRAAKRRTNRESAPQRRKPNARAEARRSSGPFGTWTGLAGARACEGGWLSRTVRWPVSRCRELQRPSARSARCTAAWASWIFF
jgi:hypothetical protein